MRITGKKAFSLIEFAIVIVIAAIIAAVGTAVLTFSIQNLVYTPNRLNMDMIAQEAIDAIVDGDINAKGLRFSRQITAVAANTVTYVGQDSKTVIITLDTGTNKLTRTINAVADSNFLYYTASSSINITVGRNGALFLYYDSAGSITSTPANVRRIEVNLIAKTQTGSFQNWQGQSEASSSIYVPKFQ